MPNTPVIVPVYAAILTAIYITLSVRVLLMRRSRKVPLGAGGDAAIERVMRVHGNFSEYVPLALLLLLMAELQGSSSVMLHALCGALLLGRGLHAWGMSQAREDFRFRVAGMAATFTVMILTAGLVASRY